MNRLTNRSSNKDQGITLIVQWASLMAQTVKNLPSMWEIWIRSLGWEDPLEKDMATHSGPLAWKIPWIEEPGYSPWGRKESDMIEQSTTQH